MKWRGIMVAITLLVFAVSNPSFGAVAVQAKTDQRIELMSIVFRLAGSPEYNMNPFKSYVSDIDEWFGPYKNHPVVLLAKQLRMTRGVSYDAVMSMAIHLGQPPALKPLVPFKSGVPDHRWGRSGSTRFLKLLRDFYQESGFSQFYANHQAMYTLAENRMNGVLAKVNFDWFEQFYGIKSSGRFNLILGIGNGGGNYGPKIIFPDGSEDLYAIMGTWLIDQDGNPDYNESVLSTIIHEFNHSFANPLVERNVKILEAPGKALFNPVKDQMSKMAYGNWKTVMYESLVRASVIQYFIDNHSPENQIRRMKVAEMSNGFLWTPQLVDLLKEYENNRNTFPELSAFMPRIAALYESLAPDIDRLKSEFSAKCARVEALEPSVNGAVDVDPALTEIQIRFDKPLNSGSGYSIFYGDQGAEHYGVTGKPAFSQDGRLITLTLQLKPDWEYSFVLSPRSFRTLDEYPLVPYTVKFRTKKL